MPVHGDDIGDVGRQAVVDRHFPSSGFVKHRDLYPVAEGRFARHAYAAYVFNHYVVGNVVVGYIVADPVYENIVADGAIVDYGIIDAGIHRDFAVAQHLVFGGSQTYVA